MPFYCPRYCAIFRSQCFALMSRGPRKGFNCNQPARELAYFTGISHYDFRPFNLHSSLVSTDYGRDLGSDRQLQAVIGREHVHHGVAPAERLEPHSIGKDDLDHPVILDRIVVEQRKLFDLCCVRQFHRDDVV